MSNDKRPREWFLNPVAGYRCEVNENGIGLSGNEVHVIEYSAYEQVLKERDDLAISLSRVRGGVDSVLSRRFEKERDELRAEVERLTLDASSARVIKRLEDNEIIPDQKLQYCKKIVSAVYLACDEDVAKDISEHIHWLIERVTAAEAEIARLKDEISNCYDVINNDKAIESLIPFKKLIADRTERDALITKLVSALELAAAQCGAPDAGDACRLILRTNKAALAEVAKFKAGKE